jgi:hypothetical protein
MKMLKNRGRFNRGTRAIKGTQIEAANALKITLNKTSGPILPHMLFQYLLRKVLDNLRSGGYMSPSQSVDIAQKRILLCVVEVLTNV